MGRGCFGIRSPPPLSSHFLMNAPSPTARKTPKYLRTTPPPSYMQPSSPWLRSETCKGNLVSLTPKQQLTDKLGLYHPLGHLPNFCSPPSLCALAPQALWGRISIVSVRDGHNPSQRTMALPESNTLSNIAIIFSFFFFFKMFHKGCPYDFYFLCFLNISDL